MKVRIGIGTGAHGAPGDGAAFGEYVDTLEELGYDSLWVTERLAGDTLEPLATLSFAAGRTTRMKLGTSVLVVPGRNPVVLAKELATIDRLSGGRLLPAVGLGAPNPTEHLAFGVRREERAAWFDEALGLMRRLWTEDDVTHEGDRFRVESLTLGPRPVQQPIEVWLGGQAPSELRRAGRLGDGWLPSFCTPDEVAQGWELVNATAAEHDRSIDPEHLGVLISFAEAEVPAPIAGFLERRRPGADPSTIVPVGLDQLRARIESFIDVGASKFVVLPLAGIAEPRRDLVALADALFDLQT